MPNIIGEGKTVSATQLHTSHSSFALRASSCAALLFFSVAATLCAEASKEGDGSYPYNTLAIPLTVEVTKLAVSAILLLALKLKGNAQPISFAPLQFLKYSLPALCYFVSNNCMFYIIKELGPTTFQVTNNLKVLTTGILMRFCLGRQLTWFQWKALVLLAIGSTVTELNCVQGPSQGRMSGYGFVVINSFAAGAGGVLSELLLKGRGGEPDSLHWQNIQLYFFGTLFGFCSLKSSTLQTGRDNFFEGFNNWAYWTVASLTACGLLVSFILKYLDNFAKCFVAASSIVFVAVIHAALQRETLQPKLVIGIILTSMAIEQYNLPQS